MDQRCKKCGKKLTAMECERYAPFCRRHAVPKQKTASKTEIITPAKLEKALKESIEAQKAE